MMKKFSKTPKLAIFILIAIICAHSASSFDYTMLTGPVSDAFIGLTGATEGATSFSSLSIPSGGKSESLGSAYAGLSDDIDFFDYNPAASSWIKNTEVNMAHNSWIADSALETVAGTVRFGHLGVGSQLKVFYVPFTEYDAFGDRVASNYYSESIAALNASYHFLPGYKFKGFAIGANVKAAWRSVPDYADDSTGAIQEGSGLSQSALGIMADVGFMMRFNALKFYIGRDPNFTVGLSLLNIGTTFTGFGDEIVSDSPLPTAVSVGASCRMIKPLTLTTEFRLPFDLENGTMQTWAFSLGAIFSFNDVVSVLGGVQLKGANPKLTLGSELKLKQVNFNVNYTLDLTSSLNPINRFSLSAKVNVGDRGRAIQQKAVDSFYGEGLEYYAEGELDAAIASWEKALAIDPYFDPAKDAIQSAREQQHFYQRIYEAQFID